MTCKLIRTVTISLMSPDGYAEAARVPSEVSKGETAIAFSYTVVATIPVSDGTWYLDTIGTLTISASIYFSFPMRSLR